MSSTSIVELFPKARRLTYELQTQLQYVERGHASPDDVGIQMDELAKLLKVLEGLVGQERPAQREDWRMKLREVGSELEFLRSQLGKFYSARRKREELLTRRHTNAHRRVLDMANILGLSNSILRVADRREAVDRLLVLGGMIITSAFLWWMWSRRTA